MVRASHGHTVAARSLVSTMGCQPQYHVARCTPECPQVDQECVEVVVERTMHFPSHTSCRCAGSVEFDTASVNLVFWPAWQPRSRQRCYVFGPCLRKTLLETAVLETAEALWVSIKLLVVIIKLS